MRFLVDAQLPPALARFLAERGHIAEHVNDIGTGDAADRELWRYALANSAAIVTKDEDFALMLGLPGDAPTIVWVRVGNTRTAALLAWFGPLLDQIVELAEGGQKLIELR